MDSLRGVDLNLLVVLAAIRDTGSVTLAAERLGLTQSGASRALARLRDTLEDPLFVVDRGQMVATARCNALSRDLDAFLLAARAVVQARAFEPTAATGALTLGMPDHLAYLHAGPLLERLRVEAPSVDLVVRAFSSDWRGELREGRVDLAFGVVRGDEGGLRMLAPAAPDPWVVLLRKGHPALLGPWTARRFAGGDHALMAVTGHGPSHVDRALMSLGLERRVRYRATSPLVVALAAATSDLRVTTTESLARALAADYPLVMRRLPRTVRPEPLRLPLVWHERAHYDERHVWARGLVAEVVLGRARAARPSGQLLDQTV